MGRQADVVDACLEVADGVVLASLGIATENKIVGACAAAEIVNARTAKELIRPAAASPLLTKEL